METVRIYEIPDCKMVTSGVGMFGEDKFDRFAHWFASIPQSMFPRDFLGDGGPNFPGSLCWYYMYEEGMDVPDDFEIVGFKGGLYAVMTDIDQQTDVEALNKIRDEFLASHGFEFDGSRPELGNIITPTSAREVLGYEQMDYYTPIKPLNNK